VAGGWAGFWVCAVVKWTSASAVTGRAHGKRRACERGGRVVGVLSQLGECNVPADAVWIEHGHADGGRRYYQRILFLA